MSSDTPTDDAHVALRHPALFLLLLSFLTAAGVVSNTLVIPSLPRMVGDFQTDPATVQLTLSVFLLSFGVAQLAWGPISDRYGRRPTILAGICIYFLASAACWFAPDIVSLIIFRFIQGVGASCPAVIVRAVVNDSFGRAGSARAMSYINAAFALTPIVAPILGSILDETFGWRANFTFLMALSAAMLLLTLFGLKETLPSGGRSSASIGQIIRNYRSILSQTTYLGYAMGAAFAYAAFFVFSSMSSFVLVDMAGLSVASYGLFLSGAFVGFGAGSYLSARLSFRFSLDRTIRVGLVVSLVSAALMCVLAFGEWFGIATAAGMFVAVSVGIGLVYPNCMAGAVAPFPLIAGTASALVGFLTFFTGAVLGTTLMQLFGSGLISMALGILGGVVAMALLYILLAGRRREPSQ